MILNSHFSVEYGSRYMNDFVEYIAFVTFAETIISHKKICLASRCDWSRVRQEACDWWRPAALGNLAAKLEATTELERK